MSRLDRIEQRINEIKSSRAGKGVKIIRDGRGNRVISTGLGTIGGLHIEKVLTLPQLPTDKPKIVWWADQSQGGTGDGQLWVGLPGKTVWYPLVYVTDKTGSPGQQ